MIMRVFWLIDQLRVNPQTKSSLPLSLYVPVSISVTTSILKEESSGFSTTIFSLEGWKTGSKSFEIPCLAGSLLGADRINTQLGRWSCWQHPLISRPCYYGCIHLSTHLHTNITWNHFELAEVNLDSILHHPLALFAEDVAWGTA